MCRFVPALLLAGCFGSHSTGETDGGPGHDAGPTPWSDGGGPTPVDAGPVPVDSGPRDAGPSCPTADVDLACFSHLTAGTPQTITVAVGGEGACFCGERISCHAAIGGEPRTLELTTGLCADGALCDGCFPFVESTCTLPPLTEGEWTVRVNGAYAFDVDVAPRGTLVEPGAACLRRATRDDYCGVVPPPYLGMYSLVCHSTFAYPDTRVPVRVTDSCGGCGVAAGPCRVDVFDDVIRVRPSSLSLGCDFDCPAVCEPREDVCWTPPLAPGSYRIRVEGIGGYESTLSVGTPHDPIDPDEICGPIVAHDDL